MPEFNGVTSRHIEAFHHVFALRSITRAALRLQVSQPSISKMIRFIEYRLGVSLFDKEGRGIVPTLEAEALFEKSSEVVRTVADFNVLATALVASRLGAIRLGCTISLGMTLVPIILRHLFSAPDRFHVDISHMQSSELESSLLKGEFDAIICFNPEESTLVKKVSLIEGRLMVAAPTNIALPDGMLRLEELAGFPFVRLKSQKHGETSVSLEEILTQNNAQMNWVAETEAISTAYALVQSGVGCAFIDEWSLMQLGSAENVAVRDFEPSLTYEIGVLYRSDQSDSEKVMSFVKSLSKVAPALEFPG